MVFANPDAPPKHRSNHRSNPRNLSEAWSGQNQCRLPGKPEFQNCYALSGSADQRGAFGNGPGRVHDLHLQNDSERQEGLEGSQGD